MPEEKPKTEIGRKKFEDNDNIRAYHGRVKLAENTMPVLMGRAAEVVNLGYLQEQRAMYAELHRFGRGDKLIAGVEQDEEDTRHPIVRSISQLVGVEYTLASAYTVVVVKGEQFSWDEIESHIKRIITTFSIELPAIDVVLDESLKAFSPADADAAKADIAAITAREKKRKQ